MELTELGIRVCSFIMLSMNKPDSETPIFQPVCIYNRTTGTYLLDVYVFSISATPMQLMIGVNLSEAQWIQRVLRVLRVQVFRVFESLCKALPSKSLRLHCAVGTKDLRMGRISNHLNTWKSCGFWVILSDFELLELIKQRFIFSAPALRHSGTGCGTRKAAVERHSTGHFDLYSWTPFWTLLGTRHREMPPRSWDC